MEILIDAHFWLGLGKITLINIVLSIDNAIVVALVARRLPVHQQKLAVAYGTIVVVVVRIFLTMLVVELLTLPLLKLGCAMALMWIAIKLLVPQQEVTQVVGRDSSLLKAIRTILLADLMTSADNVLSVAAAADGNTVLLTAGLALSIPLVIFGATMLMKLMGKWPIIITIGAGLLGWVAGEMLVTDPAWANWLNTTFPWLHVHFGKIEFSWVQVAGAAFVVLLGKHLAKNAEAQSESEHKIVDLAAGDQQNQPNK